jgi:tetratricopeptide (TPR) repeat protein/SAM-dependent methyltransferase
MVRKGRHAGTQQAGSHGSNGAELFARAVRHHQAGQLLEAESLYRRVLASDGSHFGSLQNLGIIALQRGQPQAAIEVLGRAIAADDRVPDCHYNMAFALQALGRLDDAIGYYQQAIRLKPDYVEAHTNLGNVLKELGRLSDAVASYERVTAMKPDAEAHYNLANALAQTRRLDDAVTHYRRALALKPNLVGAHNNLANVLAALGRSDDAMIHFQRALKLDPRLVDARVNFGATLLQQGNPDAAAAQLERALSINASFADAHANLGNVRLAQGRLADAEKCYRSALALKPNLTEAHNNLGIVLAARGDFAEASRRFQEALARKPDYINAYNNLARAFLAMGQWDNALGAVRRALMIAETDETKSLFVLCAQVLPAPPDVDDFRSLMIRALSEPWGRANGLASIAARAVKQDAAVRACMARAAAARPPRLPADELLGPGGLGAVLRHRLLICLMQLAGISDMELELLLTAVRFAMLEVASTTTTSEVAREAGSNDEIVNFCCALARQCFLNEQVFAVTAEEIAHAEGLRESVVAALASGGNVPELQLAVVAMYFPLHSLPGAEALLDRAWSNPVAGLLVQQVREPAEERQLRSSIPALTPIDDEVSHQVKQQYEENPYPRWTQADPPSQPLPFDQYLRRKLPAAVFQNLGKTQIDVLIAGCGTGQHPIEAAQMFAGANVLAVDLSLTSLAFAKRKTRELGRTNIEYAQADILKLDALGRSFDLIESSGVLHHLGNPFAGWRVLLSLLRPGGFMTIGLYSEIARANIATVRAFIAERGYGSTVQDIRLCRQEIVALDEDGRFRGITRSVDFFSTSGCRDLLFHAQEHRLTLPQIADFIAHNGLAFVGFNLDHFTTQRYLTRFPHDTAMSDLASWDAFEREQPGTFAGMYQFWVQKKA